MLGKLVVENYTLNTNQIPQSEINLQRNVARNMGIDTKEIQDEQFKKQLAEQQRNSLTKWTNYLSSSDALFPSEFKYFVLRSVTKLDKDGEKRSKKSTSEFPPLSPSALAKVYDILVKNNVDLTTEEIDAKEANGNKFWKLYNLAIRKSQEQMAYNLENQAEGLEGVWRKFDQGSEGTNLALAVTGSGWCTAGAEMADAQLECGDFYVYFTRDKNTNLPTIPRIAIRMQEGQIAEVRGIKGGRTDENGHNADQEIESELVDTVSEKLKEFPDAEDYQEKVDDMKQLTGIEYKTNNDIALSKDEARFLYELDKYIRGFGYDSDPRIEEIKSQRNEKQDLAIALGIDESLIATKYDEFNIETEFATIDTLINPNYLTKESKIIQNVLRVLKTVERIYGMCMEYKYNGEYNAKLLYQLETYKPCLEVALIITEFEEKTKDNEEIPRSELENFYRLSKLERGVNEEKFSFKARYSEVLKMRNQTEDLAKISGIKVEKIAVDVGAIKPETNYIAYNNELIFIEKDEINQATQQYINIINKAKTNLKLDKIDLAYLLYKVCDSSDTYVKDTGIKLDLNKLKEAYNIPDLKTHKRVFDIIENEILNLYGVNSEDQDTLIEHKKYRNFESDQAEFLEVYSDEIYDKYEDYEDKMLQKPKR